MGSWWKVMLGDGERSSRIPSTPAAAFGRGFGDTGGAEVQSRDIFWSSRRKRHMRWRTKWGDLPSWGDDAAVSEETCSKTVTS